MIDDMNRPQETRGQEFRDMRHRYATRNSYEKVERARTTVVTPATLVPKAMTGRKTHKARSRLPVLALAAVVTVIVASAVGYQLLKPTKQIPPAIAKQVSFGVFLPPDKSGVAVDSSSFSYNKSEGVLNFTVVRADGMKLSFTEQATPESFVDVPQVYDKLISSLHGYSSFDSVNGRVNLTHPPQLKGGEAAVMNAKGTLMFVRSSKVLPDDEWRQLFSRLELDRQ
jgi:hypothetical protein